jgi:CubicO group peptidase (beta-lactamase class C family)
LQGETTIGYAGHGGQMVIADPTNKLSIAYLTSYLSIYSNGDDPKITAMQKAVYNSLQKYIYRKERMAKT